MSNKDKKFKEGEEEQSAINWDGSSYFSTKLMEEMKSMWEVRKSLIFFILYVFFFVNQIKFSFFFVFSFSVDTTNISISLLNQRHSECTTDNYL